MDHGRRRPADEGDDLKKLKKEMAFVAGVVKKMERAKATRNVMEGKRSRSVTGVVIRIKRRFMGLISQFLRATGDRRLTGPISKKIYALNTRKFEDFLKILANKGIHSNHHTQWDSSLPSFREERNATGKDVAFVFAQAASAFLDLLYRHRDELLQISPEVLAMLCA